MVADMNIFDQLKNPELYRWDSLVHGEWVQAKNNARFDVIGWSMSRRAISNLVTSTSNLHRMGGVFQEVQLTVGFRSRNR